MPIASKNIEQKVMKWPAAKRIALAEKLMASVEDFASPEIENSWNAQIETRVMEIREGNAVGIPAEKVMAEARQRLNEARRISSARRRRTD